jgi:PilZ domain
MITVPIVRANDDEREDDFQNVRTSLGSGVDVLIKTSSFDLVGVIQDVQTHALSIAVHRPLLKGSTVLIEFGAETRQGEIVSCRRNGNVYQACIVVANTSESDRRTAERFPLTQEVKISSDTRESQLDGEIVDLSAHGIGLEIPTPLEPKEVVTVESVSNVAFGIVRHCRQLDDGRFHAGVEVFHVMPKERVQEADHGSVVERLFQ